MPNQFLGEGRESLKRVFAAAECRTQGELAALLGIGQSSISDAKRRGSVPYEWIVVLFLKKRINPAWILTGEEPRVVPIAPQDVLHSPPEPISPEPISPEPISPEPISPEPISPEPVLPDTLPLACYSTDELVQEIVRRGVRGLAERVA